MGKFLLTGYSLEPDSVEGEPRQLADLYLPLDQGVSVGVSVHTQEQEPLTLLVVTVVGVQHLGGDSYLL